MKELKYGIAAICAMLGTAFWCLPWFLTMFTTTHEYTIHQVLPTWVMFLLMFMMGGGWLYMGVFLEREERRFRDRPDPKRRKPIPKNVIKLSDVRAEREKLAA